MKLNFKLQMKNAAATSERLQNINKQAEALSRFMSTDLSSMREENEMALSKLRQQLEFYGDDINAFMRGGREAINEYRDSVLNSETVTNDKK